MGHKNTDISDSLPPHIIEQIETLVKGAYSKWAIGITYAPKRSKDYHDHPITWWQWDLSENERKAKAVHQYFNKKGMRDVENHKSNARYLYIF